MVIGTPYDHYHLINISLYQVVVAQIKDAIDLCNTFWRAHLVDALMFVDTDDL